MTYKWNVTEIKTGNVKRNFDTAQEAYTFVYTTFENPELYQVTRDKMSG